MALPNFMYGDPSKHVDFIRRRRKEHKRRYPESKPEQAKKELEALFEGGKQSNKKER